MNEKEKQIELLIHEIRLGVMKGGIGWRTVQIAEQLYDAGYRKQSVGEWIFNKGRTYGEPAYYCSNCWEGESYYGFDKFCPNCGAKMKGGE